MKKDPLIFLKHIRESIESIESYMEGYDKHFFDDRKVQDAVIRRLEIIGEAVKNIPKEFTKKHKSIPWSEIARMRDKLIHKYFGVDLDLTFDVVKKDLPELKKNLDKILSKKRRSKK